MKRVGLAWVTFLGAAGVASSYIGTRAALAGASEGAFLNAFVVSAILPALIYSRNVFQPLWHSKRDSFRFWGVVSGVIFLGSLVLLWQAPYVNTIYFFLTCLMLLGASGYGCFLCCVRLTRERQRMLVVAK